MSFIPTELMNTHQWVAWKIEFRNGKSTKIPIDPNTGRKASSTDPRTWSDYPTAMKAMDRFKLDGVGFVFSDSDAFVGIDLDNCRDPKTGEIAPKAQRIVSFLNSFSEVSPSGRGLHIFVKGKFPSGGNRINGINWWE